METSSELNDFSEVMQNISSVVYIPSMMASLVLLLVGFVLVSYLSKFNLALFAENFLLARYTSITRRIHLPKHHTPKQFTPSISFMGGGQLWMFAIGVGHYVYENYDIDRIKFLASSSGCFSAVPLACGLDPYDWCTKDWAKCIEHFTSRGLIGCLCDSKHFYYNLWNEYLPEDAHVRCTGRLFISVTQFPFMGNRVISKFNTRDELIWTIVGSICLPFVFIRDFPVRISDELGYVMDGGFSNDAPCLDSYTITVSALHREADIKPVMDEGVPEQVAWREYHSHDHDHDRNNNNGTESDLIQSNLSLSSADYSEADSDDTVGAGVLVNSGVETGISPRRSQRLRAKTPVKSRDSALSATTTAAAVAAASYVGDTFSTQQQQSGLQAATKTVAQWSDAKRIRALDIIQVPKYERVWEIGGMGQESAAKCLDFHRHEWTSIAKKK